MRAFRTVISCLFVLAPLAAQSPSASVYGAGCSGLNLSSKWPVVGGNWELSTVGIPAVSPFAITFIGTSAINAGVPLPALGINAPGCSAYLGNILTDMTSLNNGGESTVSLPLPNDPQLINAQLSVQSLSLTLANPSWIATSNGLTGTIGANPGFTNLAFNNQSLFLDYGNGVPPQFVVLNGFVAVTPTGFANGQIMATFADGSHSIVQYAGANVILSSGTTQLDLDVGGGPFSLLHNGNPVPIGPVLDGLFDDLLTGNGPGNWDQRSTALLGLLAIGQTAQMQNNFLAGQVLGAAAPGWICKASAAVFSVAAAALAFAGCNAIAVACGASATITVGGSVIACGPLIVACYAGLVASPAAAYLWYLSNIWS